MDVEKIEQLIKVLQSSKTEELSVHKGEFRVSIRKGKTPAPAAKASTKPAKQSVRQDTQPAAPDEHFILAPMVGIFHTIDGIARAGAKVEEGQVIGSIESMKLLNDVVSGTSGIVSEVLVEDGMPVEYGQPLCRVEPG